MTSLVYASFTFIFFALEGLIMAQGLHLGLGIPLWLGDAASALMIPPLVVFGMTLLSKMQLFTQPLWLIGMFLPFIVIAININDPTAYSHWTHYGGASGGHAAFSFVALGAGAGIALSMIAQIAEQVLPTVHADQDARVEPAVVDGGGRGRRGMGRARGAQAGPGHRDDPLAGALGRPAQEVALHRPGAVGPAGGALGPPGAVQRLRPGLRGPGHGRVPVSRGTICSLCCTLERSCEDVCKTVDAGVGEAAGIALPMAGVAG